MCGEGCAAEHRVVDQSISNEDHEPELYVLDVHVAKAEMVAVISTILGLCMA